MRVRRPARIMAVLLVTFLLLDGALLVLRERYREETVRLRAGIPRLEQQRAEAATAAAAEKAAVMGEIMRRQVQSEGAIHLAVNTDSAFVALDRGGARLRTMPARIGPERRVGTAPDTVRVSVPRGIRAIERLLGDDEAWPLPSWLWADRGMAPPVERGGPGWTGPAAIVTTGGTLFYALPVSGPLADSSYVMPGAIRLTADDLSAIRENLSVGTKVYFY